MICLRAKNVEFEVTYINLSDKPDWFLEISPHGKVPVLLVDDVPLFESNAIAEYLDETVEPRLHQVVVQSPGHVRIPRPYQHRHHPAPQLV